MAEVSRRVSEIRGLPFLRPVPVKIGDDATLRDYARRRLAVFYGPDQLELEATAYRLLGLWPGELDLAEALFELLEEQVGAFYAPEAGEFYVMADAPRVLVPLIVAHELTHALEDQHFALDARLRAARLDEDRAFAMSAVHEGSATILMSFFAVRGMLQGELEPDGLQALGRAQLGQSQRLLRAPELLRRALLAPYGLGMGFLLRGEVTRAAAGFPRADVDRCYRDPPLSSEQILHPEKYWDPRTRDLPQPVDLGVAGRRLGRGWRRLATGVLGELMVGLLVGAPTPATLEALQEMSDGAAWSNAASEGWDGDRWELWGRGERRALLLASVWDSEHDAREFAAAVEARGFSIGRCGARVALVVGGRGKRHGRVLRAMLGSCTQDASAPPLLQDAAGTVVDVDPVR